MRTLGLTVLVTAFGLTAISTIIVALRFYCRRFLLGALKPCDCTILAALLTTWGIVVTNFYQVKHGTGVHVKQLDKRPSNVELNLKAWYAYQILYLFDLCLIKFSIMFFYLGFATQKVFRISIYVSMIAIGIFSASMIFVNAFECGHPADSWSVKAFFHNHNSCRDLHPIYFGQAAFNIFSDLVLLILPMPTLMGLRMSVNKRLAVLAIFSGGLIAVMASVVRLYAVYLWSTAKDISYVSAYISMWSQVEINVAILCASIPALKPLFKKTFSNGQSTDDSSSQKDSFAYADKNRPQTIGSFKRHVAKPSIDSSIRFSELNSSRTPRNWPMSTSSRGMAMDMEKQQHEYYSKPSPMVSSQPIPTPAFIAATNNPRSITRSVTIERSSVTVPQDRKGWI